MASAGSYTEGTLVDGMKLKTVDVTVYGNAATPVVVTVAKLGIIKHVSATMSLTHGTTAGPVVVLSSYAGAYASGTTYAVGQVVTSAGIFYIAITGSNTGNTPASSASNWKAIVPGPCSAQNTFIIFETSGAASAAPWKLLCFGVA
jgi:hypothetical protein